MELRDDELLLETQEHFIAFTPEGFIFAPAVGDVYHVHKAYASGQVSSPFCCGSLAECRDWLDRYKAIDAASDPDGRERMRRRFVCRCADNSGSEHADPDVQETP